MLGAATPVGIGNLISDNLLYEVIFFLHILFAIIGIGTVFLNGLRAADAAKLSGREAQAVNESNVTVSGIAEYFIYGIFVTGLIMGLMADEPVSLGDFWLSAAIVLFIIAIGISHGILTPTEKKINAATAAALDAPGGADASGLDLEAMGKKVAMSGAALDIIVLVILYLMVWKPGLI